jgi:hypothetical protein
MLRYALILLFLASTLRGAEPWTPARDYWGPEDAEGFLQALLPPATVEKDFPERPQLRVQALHQKAFVHRSRRQAEVLAAEPLLLEESARIYSPSQSYIAVTHGDAALMIMHPQTSLSIRSSDKNWQFTFIGDRGLVRISTRQHSLPFRLDAADPQSAWKNVEFNLGPDSDLYLRYDRKRMTVFTIRGRALLGLAATRPLQSIRPQGLLLTWEEKQLRRQAEAYELDIFSGQELRLEAADAYRYHIGLPQSAIWQPLLLRSSPQLGDAGERLPALTASLLELRKNWLKTWIGDDPPTKESAYRFLQEGRWEEAYELIKTLESEGDLEYRALAAICLYRLHQEAKADAKQKVIDASSLWAEITKQEALRSRLRRKARHELTLPKDFRHARIPLDELYLLATNEQSEGRWRSALDLWERWSGSQSDALIQESYKEWQRHLDQKKPWAYAATLEIGWSDNVLHLPSGLDAPPELGHRSSWLLRSRQTLSYLVERSEAFRVQLEPSFQFTIFQHNKLADLQRFEPGLALPLQFQLPWSGQSIRLKPYISRLMQGSGGLDRFGYEGRWQFTLGSLNPELIWAQEQNLDFAPTVDHRLDALSGERVGALDRSVRFHILGVRSGMWEALWQTWDYRYAGSEEDDRQRFVLRGAWAKEFPYDLKLDLQASLHQDLFNGTRASVSGLHIRTELSLLYWQRLLPTLALERSMRQSGDSSQAFAETLILSGLDYRW